IEALARPHIHQLFPLGEAHGCEARHNGAHPEVRGQIVSIDVREMMDIGGAEPARLLNRRGCELPLFAAEPGDPAGEPVDVVTRFRRSEPDYPARATVPEGFDERCRLARRAEFSLQIDLLAATCRRNVEHEVADGIL